MSLRALLNDEPQDPISSLPSRSNPNSTSPNVTRVSSSSASGGNGPSHPIPFPSVHPHSPSAPIDGDYPRNISAAPVHPQTNGTHRSSAHGSPAKKSRRNDMLPGGDDVYQNGDPMDVEMGPNGTSLDAKTGSTGRSNLMGRKSPEFNRPRAYSSDLEEHTRIWQAAVGKYALKTRTKMKDVERIFHEHNQQTIAAFSTNLKSQIASRLLKIQARAAAAAQAKASSRPYSSLIVGSPDYSRPGSENGDGYGYDDDELRGDDAAEGVRYSNSGVKREWDGVRHWEASTAPSANEGESYTPVKRDGRRRKPIMDPDEDNDSVPDGSAAGTPKRSSKKRKVEAGAGAKGAGLLAPKLPIAAGGKGTKKPTRRSARGREVGLGRVGLKEWNIPYSDIGPPPLFTLSTSISTIFLPRTLPGSSTTAGVSHKL